MSDFKRVIIINKGEMRKLNEKKYKYKKRKKKKTSLNMHPCKRNKEAGRKTEGTLYSWIDRWIG